MIIENLPQIGDSILSQKAEPVQIIDQSILDIVQNLTDTFKNSSLIGMAAPQIGHGKRIFVTEIKPTEYRKPEQVDPLRIFIDPKITRISDQIVSMFEGCGSVYHSDLFGPVERPESIEIEAYDLEYKKFTLKAAGLLARVIQHEYDHLDGILFIDKISDISDVLSWAAYRKQQQAPQTPSEFKIGHLK